MTTPQRVLSGFALLALSLGIVGCDQGSGPPSRPSKVDTFSARGAVTDSAFRNLAGAKIQVLDGPSAGRSALTDETGWFFLQGVFDDQTRFEASKPGYGPATDVLLPGVFHNPTGAFRVVSLILGVPSSPISIAGDYTLTFVADAACTDLPPVARTRSYEVTIAPDNSDSRYPAGTQFQAHIAGGAFWNGERTFPIGLAGQLVTFLTVDDHPYFVEELGANTYLTFPGRAEAVVESGIGASLSAWLHGAAEYTALREPLGEYYYIPPQASTHVKCISNRHQLILERR